MSNTINERVCAGAEDGIVVFLIGMRINKSWKVWKWLPVAKAMVEMLRDLQANPALGLLSFRPQFGLRNLTMVQYWRSAAELQAYAHAARQKHLPAWQAFNRHVGTSGDVGIWHETYVVPPGHAEAIYANMPRFGLGLVSPLHPAKDSRATAAKRLAGVASRA